MHINLDKKQKLIQLSGILRSPKRIYKNKILQNKLGIKSLKVLKQYDNIITALKFQFNDNWDIFINNDWELFIIIYYPTMELYTPKHNLRKTIKEVYIKISINFSENSIRLGPPRLFRGCLDMYEYDKGFLYSHSPRKEKHCFSDYYFSVNKICLGHSEIEESLTELNINETFEIEELKTFFFYLDVILPIEDTDGVYYSINSLQNLTLSDNLKDFKKMFNVSKTCDSYDYAESFLKYITDRNRQIQEFFDIKVQKRNLIIEEKENFEEIFIEFLRTKDIAGLYFIKDGNKYCYKKDVQDVQNSLYNYQKNFINSFTEYLNSRSCRFIYFRGEKILPKIQTYNIQKKDAVKDVYYLSPEYKIAFINNFKKKIFNEYYRKQYQNFCTQIF
jgi:hypothetical protein